MSFTYNTEFFTCNEEMEPLEDFSNVTAHADVHTPPKIKRKAAGMFCCHKIKNKMTGKSWPTKRSRARSAHLHTRMYSAAVHRLFQHNYANSPELAADTSSPLDNKCVAAGCGTNAAAIIPKTCPWDNPMCKSFRRLRTKTEIQGLGDDNYPYARLNALEEDPFNLQTGEATWAEEPKTRFPALYEY
jgi:hypothetical protein